VLAHHQRETATRFAKGGEDKFSGLEWTRGYADLPVLPGCAARFECELANSFDVGDHVILVGCVVNFDTGGGAPLLFHQGRFGKLSDYPLPEAGAEADSSFREDFRFCRKFSGGCCLVYDRLTVSAGWDDDDRVQREPF
jgi:3-hydroxy-9,10-secoandrosta-1,3,5(10)-triene-9,17-dione monooxygenase reductase component